MARGAHPTCVAQTLVCGGAIAAPRHLPRSLLVTTSDAHVLALARGLLEEAGGARFAAQLTEPGAAGTGRRAAVSAQSREPGDAVSLAEPQFTASNSDVRT